ncbi:MAG: 30S ribosomal protein S24e [Candidatus Bathyarchaeota archaeon]|nr:MAG: 30S ribosomal protein S24e [Candidatus Bathyarchaeota archaeon]
MNPLISRREVTFEVEEPATPNRSEIRRELAVLLKTEIDQVWVRSLDTKSGTHRTVGLAHVYDDAERALQVEPDHIIKRNQIPAKEAEEE